jgi:thiol-disulfide isomerase/thioredoxin
MNNNRIVSNLAWLFLLILLHSCNRNENKIFLSIESEELSDKKLFLYRASDYTLIDSASANTLNTFEFSFVSKSPDFYFLEDNKGYPQFLQLYLKSGDTLSLKYKDSVEMQGSAAYTNLYSYRVDKLYKQNEKYSDFEYLNFNDFKDVINDFKEQNLKFFEDYFKNTPCPADYENYIKAEINYRWILDHFTYIKYHNYYTTGIFKPVSQDSLSREFLSELKLNESKYYFASSYERILGEYLDFVYTEEALNKDSIDYTQEMLDKFKIIKSKLEGKDREITLQNFSHSFSIYLSVLQDDFYTNVIEIKNYYDSIKTIDYHYNKFLNKYRGLMNIAPGSIAPNFTLKDSSSNNVSLSDFKGKVVYATFWGTWCGPCINSLPKYLEIQKKYKSNGDIVFLYIALEYDDDDIQRWKKFIKEKKFTGTHIVADKQFRNEQLAPYQINFAPSYLLIDKQGKIVSPRANRPNEGIEEQINKLLTQ